MLDGLRQNAGSWIIKILFGIIILAFVFAYGSGTLSNRGGAVLAYVGETPILIKDFQTSYSRELEQLRAQMPDISAEDLQRMGIKERVLSTMVNNLLVRQSAAELGLIASDEEVKGRVREIGAFRNQQGGFDTAMYRAVLHSNNLTPAEFEASLRADIMAQKLQRHLGATVAVDEAEARDFFLYGSQKVVMDYLLLPWADFKAGIEPTQTEIDAYYESNKERFRLPARATLQYLTFTPQALAKAQPVGEDEIKAYYEAHTADFASPEQVRARHILIKLDPGADDKAAKDARAKLLGVKAELAKGKDFAALAKKYSQGPSNVRGGDLGWFAAGMMVPEFEQAAFALKPGQVSEPVRTDFGWHLIKVEERRAAGTKSLEEATGEIKTLLAEEKAAGLLGGKLDQAIDQIIVGDALPKVAEALDMNLESTGPMTKEMLAQNLGIDADSAQALFDLPVGTASDTPVSVEGGYLLAAKTHFVDATYSPVDKVADAIREALVREAAMRLAKEKADTALAELLDPEGAQAAMVRYGKKIASSEPFGRQGVVPGLGMNPSLVEAVFASPTGKWLETAYPVADGFVLARLAQRIDPPEDVWKKQQPMLMAQLAQYKGQEMFMAYLESLRDEAKIEVVAPKLMEYQ